MDESFADSWYRSDDGLNLYYRDYAAHESVGVPLLCLPGLTRNSLDFHEFACRHRQRRRIVCPDFRGRGRSDRSLEARYDGPTTIDDIRHLLAVLGLERVVVVGTSFGGLMAMAMGVALPTVLQAVVLNDVGPDLGTDGLDKIRAYLRTEVTLPDWETAVAAMKVNFARSTISEPHQWRRLAEGTFVEGDDGRLRYGFDINLAKLLDPPPDGPPDLWAMFNSLAEVPTMVVRGGDSQVLTADTLARMAEAHPGLVQVTQPGCGHPPLLDEPLVRETLDAFLARH